MLSEILVTVTQIGILAFVVTSMAAMGLGLTVDQIVGPLRDLRTVGLLLVANFVVVPVVAVVVGRVLPMDDTTATALIIYGCCAGAPFLPKLAQLAKGDVALSVGAMVLLMVVTVAFAPIVLPLVVEGATVDAFQIASSLVLFMLVPLGVALLVRARYPDLAAGWVGPTGHISSTALMIGIAAGLLVSWRDILGAIGSWVFVGVAILLVAALAAGYLAGIGRDGSVRRVVMFATGQRNLSAALVVAGSLGGDVIVLTMVGGLALVVVLIVLAGELGRRLAGAATATENGTTG